MQHALAAQSEKTRDTAFYEAELASLGVKTVPGGAQVDFPHTARLAQLLTVIEKLWFKDILLLAGDPIALPDVPLREVRHVAGEPIYHRDFEATAARISVEMGGVGRGLSYSVPADPSKGLSTPILRPVDVGYVAAEGAISTMLEELRQASDRDKQARLVASLAAREARLTYEVAIRACCARRFKGAWIYVYADLGLPALSTNTPICMLVPDLVETHPNVSVTGITPANASTIIDVYTTMRAELQDRIDALRRLDGTRPIDVQSMPEHSTAIRERLVLQAAPMLVSDVIQLLGYCVEHLVQCISVGKALKDAAEKSAHWMDDNIKGVAAAEPMQGSENYTDRFDNNREAIAGTA